MAQTNLIGQKILGYKVEEKLGSGAFGTVYKVVKTNVAGQYVRALKHITLPTERQYYTILKSMGGDVSKVDNYFSKMLKNIVTEINILNELSEKGGQYIVRYYENDIEETESPKRYDIFILMEYLTPLEDYLQCKEVCVRDIIKMGKDVLEGLKTCHENGIIHRDIKDDNIFISEQGDYKIGDFGVSKVLKDSSKAESLKGTPNFLAPEVYLGRESYTKSVDLYSLGIVLYRLLNYSRNPLLPHYPEPFDIDDENIAFEKRMRGEIPDLPSLGGKYIGSVIVKSISGKDERFQTAEEFLAELEWAEENTPIYFLEEKISFNTFDYIADNSALDTVGYKETIGETIGETYSTESKKKDKTFSNKSINKYLFESTAGNIFSEETISKDQSSEGVNDKPKKEKKAVTKKKTSNHKKKWILPVILSAVIVGAIFVGVSMFSGTDINTNSSKVPPQFTIKSELMQYKMITGWDYKDITGKTIEEVPDADEVYTGMIPNTNIEARFTFQTSTSTQPICSELHGKLSDFLNGGFESEMAIEDFVQGISGESNPSYLIENDLYDKNYSNVEVVIDIDGDSIKDGILWVRVYKGSSVKGGNIAVLYWM